jgi:hypothetical protein
MKNLAACRGEVLMALGSISGTGPDDYAGLVPLRIFSMYVEANEQLSTPFI